MAPWWLHARTSSIATCPDAMHDELPQIAVKPHKGGTFRARHPWVLAKSIVEPAAPPADGAAVDLVSADGAWIARGIYNSRSHIRVRLYTWSPFEQLDEAFWRGRLESAIALRRTIGYDDPQGAARLVFSEADGLSGLIVDRYGTHLVVQVTALAMATRIDTIVRLLADLVQPAGITVRSDRKIAAAEGMTRAAGPAWGDPLPSVTTITEYGVRYRVELGEGQKTGYYLDQRENRAAAARYLAGRRVLDMFCYLGGFSLAAARLGQAAEVLACDSSQRAIDQARTNAAENGLTNVHFEVAEAFERLETLRAAGARFGAVILDPPRFAGSRMSIDHALRAYHRLNRLGVELLEPDGILVTCSCSGRVTRDDFRRMLLGVAQKTRRDVQLLEQRGAAPDHPVRVTVPESEYLKCFIARVP
jgi:23S rRNA (cytosine1962-C5)-methyltransferase